MFKPEIIENYNQENIEKWLKENNVYLNIVDNPTLWAAFANKYGREHGLSEIESASFSYMVSMFLGGMGVSASTEEYYNEEKIEFEIVDIINNLEGTEEERAKELFFKILEIYQNNISRYERKVVSLSFRLTQSEYDRFMEIPGDSKSEKMHNLFLKIL